MSDTKYPDIEVELIGTNGNVYALIGKVTRAIRREVGTAEAEAFSVKAQSQSSYDDVLVLIMDTVEVT